LYQADKRVCSGVGVVADDNPCPVKAQEELPPQPDALLVQQYITQYDVVGSAFPVFGVFELGHRPSCVIHLPSSRGGSLSLKLHGRVYQKAVMAPFFIWFAFEGDEGSIIQESSQFSFTPSESDNRPTWFKDTENTSGFYGDQPLTIDVPKGTEAVWILGENDTLSTYPNQLLGYVSHFQFKAAAAARIDKQPKQPASPKRTIRRRR
jgi:hypothetical protein